ncbi:DUF2332 domain-containing protein [Novosphingobium album (ex Liu et al. 2023)]|uniref:DUF2332 domain-containing protein n=1 Tax=Novosphingobium album (ex Liu et al. 2023) TaxID=3031130 RepID=A0ABT5WPP5_9SPHN|nr:DUF2332 domain-containing protein [Novosphingobium album (ex Liu et al. 2023)]MDE8651976.1 DUF2332 domain-containing protein [Novosphingobium album (ex Liu et al. 2023)]
MDDVASTGAQAVALAFANQVAYCQSNGANVTARIVAALGALLDDADAGPLLARIRDWPGAPLADGLPLRTAGALHSLHLTGREPALAAIYAGELADDVRIVRDAVRRQGAALLPWLDGPPQTNEAGRSSNFIAGMLWLAAQGLPARFECFEIGSSAGINLMIDRYRYDLGGIIVGPEQPVIAFAPEWRGPPPPPGPIAIASLKGCDVAPVDLADPEQALRLRAYIWPEHAVRFARLEAAIAAARRRPPDLVAMRAADFVEKQLARPQAAGTTRVLMHSIVWQYLPEDEKRRITEAMEAAGRSATGDRALAWIALEANRELLHHGLTVRYWPGGEEPRLIAAAHAHGAWIDWRG